MARSRWLYALKWVAALAIFHAAPFCGPLSARSNSYQSGGEIYRALREGPVTTVRIGEKRIDVVFADGDVEFDRGAVLDWVKQSGIAIQTYFGGFPVPDLPLLIVMDDGQGIHGGTTFGFDGPAIRVYVGRHARAEEFKKDWILVHEMVHASMPTVPDQSLWVMEGEAVYVEPIARAQAGQIDASEVWRWSLFGMPKGQPEPGDTGLDHDHVWGRTYWGGAAFWLMAEVQIRERTNNQVGLQTALRAISRESGGNRAQWTVQHMMSVGDAATGGHELSTLYERMKDLPAQMDLENLFARLGVAMRDSKVIENNDAPLAAIRRRVTASPG